MALSGTRTFIQNRDDIIKAALRKIQAIKQGEAPSASQLVEANQALNVMVQSWQLLGVFLWTMEYVDMALTAGTSVYTVSGDDIIAISDVMYRVDGHDTPVSLITPEEYAGLAVKTSQGRVDQLLYEKYLASLVMRTYYVPAYTTGVVQGSNSLYYRCIKSHTSSSDDAPITGSDYATYWTATTNNTGSAWVTATSYYSDTLFYLKYKRLQDFNISSDNPDFPVEWSEALIYGLAARLAPEYGTTSPDTWKTLELMASMKFAEAKDGSGSAGCGMRLGPYLSGSR
jgi:hypothetical protein